jgi:hypothetical protein
MLIIHDTELVSLLQSSENLLQLVSVHWPSMLFLFMTKLIKFLKVGFAKFKSSFICGRSDQVTKSSPSRTEYVYSVLYERYCVTARTVFDRVVHRVWQLQHAFPWSESCAHSGGACVFDGELLQARLASYLFLRVPSMVSEGTDEHNLHATIG